MMDILFRSIEMIFSAIGTVMDLVFGLVGGIFNGIFGLVGGILGIVFGGGILIAVVIGTLALIRWFIGNIRAGGE